MEPKFIWYTSERSGKVRCNINHIVWWFTAEEDGANYLVLQTRRGDSERIYGEDAARIQRHLEHYDYDRNDGDGSAT